MPIPDYQTLMQPLLALLENGEDQRSSDLLETLCVRFDLSDAERSEMLPSGGQARMTNRVYWARTYLKQAGLIEFPARGSNRITPAGQQALQEGLARIDVRYLRKFPEFIAFTQRSKNGSSSGSSDNIKTEADPLVDDVVETLNPEEQLRESYQRLRRTLSTDLLDQIKGCTPIFFEKLVVDLMLAMGYGGSDEDTGHATQYTADGGIDGIIKQDPLGLDNIYLQAKRYTDATIGRPEIQKFAGALDMQRAKKGVFITTSRFSREALEFVELIEKQIILIDGEKLADLMITYNLGTSVKETFTLKAVDTDYFLED